MRVTYSEVQYMSHMVQGNQASVKPAGTARENYRVPTNVSSNDLLLDCHNDALPEQRKSFDRGNPESSLVQ
jgi:hypothetical protein